MDLFFLIQKCEYEHKITSTWKRSQVQYLMTVFINSLWFNIIVIACNRDCVSKKTNSDHIIAATQQGPWKPHNCLRITGFTFRERGEDIDPSGLVKGRLGNHWFFGHVYTIDAMPIQNNSEFIIDVHIDKVFWVLFRNIQGFRIHSLSILASKTFIITRKDEMNVFFLMREKLSTCNAAVVNVYKYSLQIDSTYTWNNQQSISFNGFNWLSLVQCLYSDGFFLFSHTCTRIVEFMAVQEGYNDN